MYLSLFSLLKSSRWSGAGVIVASEVEGVGMSPWARLSPRSAELITSDTNIENDCLRQENYAIFLSARLAASQATKPAERAGLYGG